jgi:uncharacterized membrane protein
MLEINDDRVVVREATGVAARSTPWEVAVRSLSFRPSLTVRGRKFKGLRGWAGKPLHPPLTDVPVGAYVLAVAFDVISADGSGDAWARDFYRAASFALVGGAVVSVLAAATGFWDWLKSTEKGTQARRTANAHAWTMVTVTVLVLVGVVVRMVGFWDEASTPGLALAFTVAVALLTFLGATIGGTLVFDYGFNVETAGDHPVWHTSEVDVFPGRKAFDAAPDLSVVPDAAAGS